MSKDNNESGEPARGNLTRRDFLKYSAGVAAVAAGATALLGKLPLQASEPLKTTGRLSPDRLVVMVNGEELTVMTGDSEVKVRDSALASAIAGKIQ